HAPLPVTHHDDRREAEPTSALHHLRHAVDVHDLLDELRTVVLFTTASVTTRTTVVPAGTARTSRPAGSTTAAAAPSTGTATTAGTAPAWSTTRLDHQNTSPSSRAASASSFTRPAYRNPPRSRTTESTPAAFARCATSAPTLRASALFVSSLVRRSVSTSDAAASVRPAASSITCA